MVDLAMHHKKNVDMFELTDVGQVVRTLNRLREHNQTAQYINLLQTRVNDTSLRADRFSYPHLFLENQNVDTQLALLFTFQNKQKGYKSTGHCS